MTIVLGDKQFEIDNAKLDTIERAQRAQIKDVIEYYRSVSDIQGLMYLLFCMKLISEEIIERFLEEEGIDNIGDIIMMK